MSIDRPFKRTVRQLIDGSYRNGGHGEYVKHPRYADEPTHYVRAFLLLQKDLMELFDYVEPSDINLPCYSYRTHELYVRTCMEVEANCKAILAENGYKRVGDWNMSDYRKLEATHRLSGYRIKMPLWQGVHHTHSPFDAWGRAEKLGWYEAYHSVKHNRHNDFDKANLGNLLNAISGLVTLLASQFGPEEFGPASYLVVAGGPDDGFEDSIGSYFRVQYPSDWPAEQRYEFNWQVLGKEVDPIQQHNY